jgi:hypothetical protein
MMKDKLTHHYQHTSKAETAVEYQWSSLWDPWKSPFMALCIPGYIMDQYG